MPLHKWRNCIQLTFALQTCYILHISLETSCCGLVVSHFIANVLKKSKSKLLSIARLRLSLLTFYRRSKMKQIALKKIMGKITVKTGLHIGADNNKIEIGGMDNPIIRNPLTQEPYIPGSSIKGKMRSLLEWKLGRVADSGGKPCSCGKSDCEICRVFGCANGKKDSDIAKQRGPTRLIVRDAVLSGEWSKKFQDGKPIVEEKSENSLNRITAEANPRPIERVVPDVQFDFEIVYRIIDAGDGGATDEKFFEEVVKEGLKLLQNDYLGGGGSRGNGRIAFDDLKDENGNKIEL